MKDKRKILMDNGWEPVMDGDWELWLDPIDETRDDPTTLKQAWDGFRRQRFMEKNRKQMKETKGHTLNSKYAHGRTSSSQRQRRNLACLTNLSEKLKEIGRTVDI
jgi:hypothetical protein